MSLINLKGSDVSSYREVRRTKASNKEKKRLLKPFAAAGNSVD